MVIVILPTAVVDTVEMIVQWVGLVNLHPTPLHVLKAQLVRTVELVTMFAIWAQQVFPARLLTLVIPSVVVAMHTAIV